MWVVEAQLNLCTVIDGRNAPHGQPMLSLPRHRFAYVGDRGRQWKEISPRLLLVDCIHEL